MNCVICNSKTNFYFTKEFSGDDRKMLNNSSYLKCCNCGFVFSETIFNMNISEFSKLNLSYHTYIEDPKTVSDVNQPPYIDQAWMLKVLHENGLIDMSSSLDFAGGLGTLNKILRKYISDVPLFKIYDPYMQDLSSNIYVDKDQLKKYSVVFTSAFFEHIRDRSTLDEINSCVADDGVLVIHTLICENVPKDPNWFYLLPVHSAFHTNKSMGILMESWGYKWSIYCPKSKCWVLFKNGVGQKVDIISRINREFQCKYLTANPIGFVGYWKGF